MRVQRRYRALVASAGVLLLVSSILSVSAATLSTNPVVQIGNNSAHNISVYPGKAAYDGLASGVFGDGTVLDYRFFNNLTIASGGYADGLGSRVSDITVSGGLTDYNMDYADVWATTDPGALDGGGVPDFSTTADFGGATKTMSGQQIVDGSIDISGLGTGTVYVLCGHYSDSFTVTLTMTGPGQTDLTATNTVAPPSTRNKHILSYNFSDQSDLYTNISYNYTGAAGNRSRFMGVILDGDVPLGAINWSDPGSSNITSVSVDVSATIDGVLDGAVLVWDTTDHGTSSTNDWPNRAGLGAQASGVVTGQLTSLAGDAYYFWRLYGIDSSLNEAWTVEQIVGSGLSASDKPTFTNATASGTNLNVTLWWQDNSASETSFVLYRSTNDTDYTLVASLAADTSTFVDTVPVPDLYYYRLSATNGVNGTGTDPSACATNIAVAAPPVYFLSAVEIGGTSFDISVYPGKASYSGSGNSGDLGDGTVLDYRFFNNGASAFDTNGYANGVAGRILPATSGTPYGSLDNYDWADIWITSDPGAGFANPADITAATIPRATDVSGDIDVSGLGSGTLYFIAGGIVGDDPKMSITVIGSGEPDAYAEHTEPNSGTQVFVFEFPVSLSGYDTISYTFSGPSASRGRFMGVIIDGELSGSAGTVFMFQ